MWNNISTVIGIILLAMVLLYVVRVFSAINLHLKQSTDAWIIKKKIPR